MPVSPEVRKRIETRRQKRVIARGGRPFGVQINPDIDAKINEAVALRKYPTRTAYLERKLVVEAARLARGGQPKNAVGNERGVKYSWFMLSSMGNKALDKLRAVYGSNVRSVEAALSGR